MPLDQETGYLEQGYANVAVAPLEMQLRDIQTSRGRLEQLNRNNRRDARDESIDLEDDRRMDEYLNYSQSLLDAGYTGDALQEEKMKGIENNVSWGSDKRITDSLNQAAQFRGHRLKVKQDDLADKSVDLQLRAVDLQSEQFAEQEEQSNAQMALNRQRLDLAERKFLDLEAQGQSENNVNFGANLQSTIGAILSPDQTKRILGTHDYMNKSDKPELQAGARSLRLVAQAIAVTDNSTQNGKASLDRHLPIMGELNKLGIETDDLYDPDKIDDAIERIKNSMDKKDGIEASDYEDVKPLLIAAATFSASHKDGKTLQENLNSLLPSIRRDLDSLDPEKKEAAQDNLASLKAKAEGQLSTARSGAKTIADNEDRRIKKNEEDARLLDLENKESLIENRENRIQISEKNSELIEAARQISTKKQASNFYTKMRNEGRLTEIGLDDDTEFEEGVAALVRFYKSGGSSSSSPRRSSGNGPVNDL